MRSAVASAAEQAFDARVFAGLAAQAEALPDVRSLVLLRRGRVAFEYQRTGQASDTLQPVESVTKNVLSLLVGSRDSLLARQRSQRSHRKA